MSWNGVDLTTADAAATFGGLRIASSDPNYAILQAMVSSVSQKMEQYCSRRFGVAPYVEARSDLRSNLFPVRNPTIQSVTSVSVSYTGRVANLSSTNQFDINADGKSLMVWGCIRPGVLVQVSYNGGLVTDTADVTANHPYLQEMANLQVVSLWQRHTMPDRSGTTLEGGTTTWTADYSLLKEVREGLDQGYNLRHMFQ